MVQLTLLRRKDGRSFALGRAFPAKCPERAEGPATRRPACRLLSASARNQLEDRGSYHACCARGDRYEHRRGWPSCRPGGQDCGEWRQPDVCADRHDLAVSAYATDADDNPASDPVRVSVQPPGLGSVTSTNSGMTLTASTQSGHGWLMARAGSATSRLPLTVTEGPASLSLSPAEPRRARWRHPAVHGDRRRAGTAR